MKKLSKKSELLLERGFGLRPFVGHLYSGIETWEGTRPLWGQLVGAGLVEPERFKCFHEHAYKITDSGKLFLKLKSFEPLNR